MKLNFLTRDSYIELLESIIESQSDEFAQYVRFIASKKSKKSKKSETSKTCEYTTQFIDSQVLESLCKVVSEKFPNTDFAQCSPEKQKKYLTADFRNKFPCTFLKYVRPQRNLYIRDFGITVDELSTALGMTSTKVKEQFCYYEPKILNIAINNLITREKKRLYLLQQFSNVPQICTPEQYLAFVEFCIDFDQKGFLKIEEEKNDNKKINILKSFRSDRDLSDLSESDIDIIANLMNNSGISKDEALSALRKTKELVARYYNEVIKAIKLGDFDSFDDRISDCLGEYFVGRGVLFDSEFIITLNKRYIDIFKRINEECPEKIPEGFFKTKFYSDPESFVKESCPYLDYFVWINNDLKNCASDISQTSCEEILSALCSKKPFSEREIEVIQRAYAVYVTNLEIIDDDDFSRFLGICEDELDDIFVTKPNPHEAEKAIKSRLAQPHPHQEFIDKIEEDSVNGTSTHYAEFCKKFGYDEICWDHWSCEVIYRAANVYVGDQGFVTIDEFAEALGVPVEREDVVEALIANGRMSEDDPDEEIDIESGELLRILLEENDCVVFRGAEVSAMYD